MSPGFRRNRLSVIRWYFHFIFAATLLAVFGASAASAYSIEEQGALDKLKMGEPVDQKGKKLDSKFLDDLLSRENPDIHRNGIRIQNAVITGPLNLQNSEMRHSVSLIDCEFQKEVIFKNTVFKHDVSFRGSKFKKEAHFEFIRVHGSADFSWAEFEGPVDFTRSKVGNDFYANATRFEGYTAFAYLQVDGDAYFDDAHFGRGVSITEAMIGGRLQSERAVFSSPSEFSSDEFENQKKDPVCLCDAMAQAGWIKADTEAGPAGCIQWLHEVLQMPDLLSLMKITTPPQPGEIKYLIEKTQDARKLPFKDLAANEQEEIRRLNRLTVELYWPEAAPKSVEALYAIGLVTGANVILDSATFNGPVNFNRAGVGRKLSAVGAKFKGNADFSSIRVDGYANFPGAEFEGPVDFTRSKLGKDFYANAKRFEGFTAFTYLQVDGDAYFNDAHFRRGVSITGANIGGGLFAGGAVFSSPSEFSSDEFESQKKDPVRLCDAMAQAGWIKAGTEAGPAGCIQWLNEVLQMPALFSFEKITAPLQPGEIKYLIEKTQDARKLPFKDLAANEQEEIKRLNRLTVELSWPEAAPKSLDALNAVGLVTGTNVMLDSATFNGPVNFNVARVGRRLSAGEAKFKGNADFSFIHVDGNAVFNGAGFEGPVDFGEAKVGRALLAVGATFKGKADFPFIHVALDADFTNLKGEFQDTPPESGYCKASDAHIKFDKSDIKGDFTVSNETGPGLGKSACFASLENTKIGGKLQIGMKGGLKFRVDGLSYEALEVAVAPLEGPSGPDVRQGWARRIISFLNKVYSLGYDYLYVPVKDFFFKSTCDDKDLEPRFTFLDSNNNSNLANYAQLESFFKSIGKEECADKAYIHGMQLQNHENNGLWYVLRLVFWDWLAGYGRRPERIFLFALLLFIAGVCVFNPKYLDDEFRERLGCPDGRGLLITPPFSRAADRGSVSRCGLNLAVRIGLSLDIFVPTHHPVYVDHWRRSEAPTWIMVYYYFHRAAGMILVAIGVAALFTHLKMHIGG